MLYKSNHQRVHSNKLKDCLPSLLLIAKQNELNLSTGRGIRIAMAVLNRSINQN